MEEQVVCKSTIYPFGRSCDRYPSMWNHFQKNLELSLRETSVARDSRASEAGCQQTKGR